MSCTCLDLYALHKMTIRSLAKDLGISPTRVAQLIRKGMPAESAEAAQAWRTTYVTAPTTAKSNVVAMHETVNDGDVPEDLGATLERLRHVERATSRALEELLRQGKVAEAAVLRREHVATVKALFDAETKAIKIAETRGRLISVDRALGMISEALTAPLIMLRRLPELGRDPEERKRLEAFLNAVLNEIKDGAQRSFNRTGCAAPSVSRDHQARRLSPSLGKTSRSCPVGLIARCVCAWPMGVTRCNLTARFPVWCKRTHRRN